MKKSIVYFSLPLLLGFGACKHKDLCFDHYHVHEVRIMFDWRNAPDANPESMAAYFFGNEETGMLRYIFQNREGDIISMPVGSYSGLGLNSDNTDWARSRHIDDIEAFETYTDDAITTEAYGLSTRGVPRAPGAEDERMAQTPGMLWTHRVDNVTVNSTDSLQTITFYPEEAVCHYTVDISHVTNLQYVDRAEIDGTISGMAEGFNHGKNCPTKNHVTMTFTLSADTEAQTLHGELLTFGECPSDFGSHMLTIYLYLTDGSKWYYNFDVTSQVHNAPDPHNVHIVLSGLPLPQPIVDGGGLIPDVTDWQTEDIDMKM
ncbi:MAG: DUF5119 domain-containing protein [Bacteroides sp.]|nr:DUF5119 domain-containing protein [Bacteroides sp.]